MGGDTSIFEVVVMRKVMYDVLPFSFPLLVSVVTANFISRGVWFFVQAPFIAGQLNASGNTERDSDAVLSRQS
jgi:hypothetical protein